MQRPKKEAAPAPFVAGDVILKLRWTTRARASPHGVGSRLINPGLAPEGAAERRYGVEGVEVGLASDGPYETQGLTARRVARFDCPVCIPDVRSRATKLGYQQLKSVIHSAAGGPLNPADYGMLPVPDFAAPCRAVGSPTRVVLNGL